MLLVGKAQNLENVFEYDIIFLYQIVIHEKKEQP